MPQLITDCLYLIFKELNSEEIYSVKNLYPCLFVNRLWCENVIHMIWADPFGYIGHTKQQSLYNLLISFCLYFQKLKKK